MIPTCPWCGQDGKACTVTHPRGRYFCACGSLFMGSDAEWRWLAQHRREQVERNAQRSQTAAAPHLYEDGAATTNREGS